MPIHQVFDDLRMLAHNMAARLGYGFADHRFPSRRRALKEVCEARARAGTPTTPLECIQIFQVVAALEKVPGDLAEVGVFRGTTGEIILRASAQKRLHLFDTFAGLPHGEGQLRQGEYSESLTTVQNRLANYRSRVSLYPGLFPSETGKSVDTVRFSFVHLDVDLYDATFASLQFFWPRLNPGGVVLSHDYPRLEGVAQAFDGFFSDQQASVIPLSGYQCMAIKTA